nr:hypothetical protein CFP56_40613 [Quercus suber]
MSCENSCNPRHLQFEADINKLFLYNRDAEEAKAKEFNEMACKASLAVQQMQLLLVRAALVLDIGRNGQPTNRPDVSS